MKQKQTFVIVHIADGCVQTVGTNNPDIVVIFADEDDNADEQANMFSYGSKTNDLYIIDTPEKLFEPEKHDNKIDAENKLSFIEQLKDIEIPDADEEELTAFGFNVEDVLQQAQEDGVELSEVQAKEVLQLISSKGDASIGVNWESISYFIQRYLKEV